MKEDKQRSIMKKGLELFCEVGYLNTTVEEITNSLNISKGSFYTYYESKEALLLSVLEYMCSDYKEIIKKVIEDNNSEKPDVILEQYIKVMIDSVLDSRNIISLIQQVFTSNFFKSENVKKAVYKFRAVDIEFVKNFVFKKIDFKYEAFDLDLLSEYIISSIHTKNERRGDRFYFGEQRENSKGYKVFITLWNTKGGTMKKVVTYLALCFSIFSAEKITIQEAAEMAVKNNRDIKIGIKELENSSIDVQKSWKDSFFKIEFASNETFFTGNAPTKAIPNSSQYSQSISLEQPIFEGGNIAAGIKTAKTGKTLSMYTLEKTKKDTVLNVINTYINVLNYENTSEVLTSSKKTLDENLRIIKEKYNLRLATKPDLLEAERSVLDVQAQILDNQNKVDTSKDELVKLIGLNIGSEIEIVPFTVQEKFSQKINYENDLKRLPDENSEYKMSELQSEMSKYKIDSAKSAFYPKVNANMSYGTSLETEIYDSFDTKNAYLTFGISFKWQLFDWGSAADDVKKAKNNLEISRLKQTDTLENLKTNLKSIYMDIVHSEKVLETRRLAVETASEVYKLETERYRYNLITLRDLLDAESNLRKSRLDYTATRLNYYYLVSKYEAMFN